MSGWLMLLLSSSSSGLVLAGLVALLLRLTQPRWGPWLTAGALRRRTLGLWLALAAPLLTALAVAAACFSPSLLAELGLIEAHCNSHAAFALHLCTGHVPSNAPYMLMAALGAVAGLCVALAVGRTVALLAAGRRELAALRAVAQERDGVHWVSSPLAISLTGGLWRPAIFLSTGLARALEPHELQAALAHERCHALERHGLLKLAAAGLAVLHLPHTGRALTRALDLALERRADEQAAAQLGDRLSLCSAIIAARRLAPPVPASLALALTDPRSSTTQRVEALLEAEPTPVSRWRARSTALFVALLLGLACYPIHNAIEHVLTLLL